MSAGANQVVLEMRVHQELSAAAVVENAAAYLVVTLDGKINTLVGSPVQAAGALETILRTDILAGEGPGIHR